MMNFGKKGAFALVLAVCFICFSVFQGCVKDSDGTAPTVDVPGISIADITIEEGDVDIILSVPVRLTGKQNTNSVVRFAAVPGSATVDSTGIDFEVVTEGGQLVFYPGDTLKVVEIRIIGDEVREQTEAFTVQIFNPINATISKGIAVITIKDDDNNTAGLTIPTTGYTSPTSYPGYNLVWADEFSADTLNTKDWTYELGAGGWGNNELQHYRQDNTSFVNGNLVITAKKQAFGGSAYTSSRLITKGKKQFKFGRIDIRAALPKGQGVWPALWMLGSNIDVVGWPACGEIDIMELTGNLPNRVLGTAHYGANVAQHQFKTQAFYLDGNKTFDQEFHVFSINWEADLIQFFVDDQLYHTITPATVGSAPYPFNKNFFFIFNIAVGGNLPGSPDGTTPFPQSMIVDYVRVFQKP